MPCNPDSISRALQLQDMAEKVAIVPNRCSYFLKRCRAQHKALRREAETRGARLFAERSRPFAERIEAYWTAAAQRAEKPVIGAPSAMLSLSAKLAQPAAERASALDAAGSRQA